MARTLLVGLGNPGAQYARTRHNIGFMAIDALARRHGLSAEASKFKGLWGSGTICGEDVVLLKPQTFMNLSGDSVQKAAAFFQIPVERVVVCHDELDLDLGQLRLKVGGGHGGHNGLRDLIAKLGSKEFARVRMGIGRPPGKGDVTGWVLGGFGKGEESARDELIESACDAMEEILTRGMTLAQNRFNGG